MWNLKRNKKEVPYNFDINEEYKIYQKVGEKNSKYLTYIQWENHIKTDVKTYNKKNRKNFVHYLKGKKRDCENSLSSIDSIWTPINIFVLTILLTFVFAFANLIKDYNGNCSNVINTHAIQDEETLYMDTLIYLEQNFNESVYFFAWFSLILIGLGVFFYNLGRYRRENLAKRIHFYEDIITILKKSNE